MKEPICDYRPFYWKEPMTEAGDADCGCHLKLDWGDRPIIMYYICYLPLPVRKLLFEIWRVKEDIVLWWHFSKYKIGE